MSKSSSPETPFQTYYKPQSDEYLHDFRTVVDRLFTKTDERMGWYEPWQAWIVTSHDLCKTILADERLTPDFMKWKFAPPEQPNTQKNDFERMLDLVFHRSFDHADCLFIRRAYLWVSFFEIRLYMQGKCVLFLYKSIMGFRRGRVRRPDIRAL